RAQLLALKESQMVVVRYYGWRLPMFSMFPNAVNLWATDTAETPLPLFNILFFSVLILVAVTVWWKIRRFRQRRQAGNQPV
ncbi:MAG: DUF1523 family protein, partial [Moraxellaceae bacterium]|nr:DUF1523 family protein [Moraxellaceae bacterium]